MGFCKSLSIAPAFETVQPREGGSPRQFRTQDGPGMYTYGYTNAESFKTEKKTADGVVRGVYG